MTKPKEEMELTEYLTAAALVASGIPLLRIVAPGGHHRRCAMIFDNRGGAAARAFQRHLSGVLSVSSREMADSIQTLKTKLFATRGGY
jgi:hypothetical protein